MAGLWFELKVISFTDSYANVISEAVVTVSGGYGANASGTTDANGSFAIPIKPTHIGGPFSLTLSVGSISLTGPSLSVAKYPAYRLTLEAAAGINNTIPNAPFGVVATLVDQFGEPVNGKSVTLASSTDPTAAFTHLMPSTPNGSGTGSLTQTTGSYAAGQAAVNISFDRQGTQIVTAAYGDLQATLTVTVNSGNITQVIWSSVSPMTLQAGGSITLSGWAMDILGNPVGSGQAITFYLKEGGAVNKTLFTNAGGYFSGSITPTAAGPKTLMAQYRNHSQTYTAALQVNPGAIAGGSIAYSTAPFFTGNPVTVKVQVTDAYGNPVSNVGGVTLSGSGTGLPAMVQPVGTTDTNGVISAVQGPFNSIGTYQYSAMVNGVPIPGANFTVYKTATPITGVVITPGTADQPIPQGDYDGTISAGRVKGDPDLIAGNIMSGINIFGVVGNALGQYASGTARSSEYNGADVVVSGLAGKPSIIIIVNRSSHNSLCAYYNAAISKTSFTRYFSSGSPPSTAPVGYVNSTGFSLDIGNSGCNVDWYVVY